MTKFFSKIRKGLVAENKFSKYLPYAFGEIFLVVVGILIALQINNWNENRINSTIELNLLKSCLEGLEKDLSDAQLNMSMHERGIQGMDYVINALTSSETLNSDSIAYKLSDAMIATYFVHSTSAFETIKAKGVNIISNDTLRDQIIEVYDSRYNFFLQFEKAFLDELDFVTREVFPGRFEEFLNNNLSHPNFEGTIRPINVEVIREDQVLLYHLKTVRNKINVLLSLHYSSLERNQKKLIKALKTEIASQEKS